MALKLNQDNEYREVDGQKAPIFKEFSGTIWSHCYGGYIVQMPLLIASGRTPMSFARVMQRRLDVRNAEADVKTAWMDNRFDTADGNARHPDGKLKIVLDSKLLREITPQSPRNREGLTLADGVYERLEGEEFTALDVEKYTEKWLTKKSAKANPFWKALARGNQKLLNDFVDYIALEYQQRFAETADDDNVEILGVFPGDKPKSPEMGGWFISSLGFSSEALGWFDFGFGDDRLVGELSPEAQVAKNLEETLKK